MLILTTTLYVVLNAAESCGGGESEEVGRGMKAAWASRKPLIKSTENWRKVPFTINLFKQTKNQ